MYLKPQIVLQLEAYAIEEIVPAPGNSYFIVTGEREHISYKRELGRWGGSEQALS